MLLVYLFTHVFNNVFICMMIYNCYKKSMCLLLLLFFFFFLTFSRSGLYVTCYTATAAATQCATVKLCLVGREFQLLYSCMPFSKPRYK